jgi:hypothetical protein
VLHAERAAARLSHGNGYGRLIVRFMRGLLDGRRRPVEAVERDLEPGQTPPPAADRNKEQRVR